MVDAGGEPTLRRLLVRALRKDALGRVCKGDPKEGIDLSSFLSQVLIFGMLMGMWLVAADAADASVALSLLVLLGIALLLALVAVITSPTTAAFILAALWAIYVGRLLVGGEGHGDLIAYGFAVSGGLGLASSARRLTRVIEGAPLILPVTLTALLIPLYTSNLWLATASQSRWKIVALAGVSVLPLLAVIVRRLQADLAESVTEAVDKRRDEGLDWNEVVNRALKVIDSDDREQLRPKLDGQHADGAVRDVATHATARRIEQGLKFQTAVVMPVTMAALVLIASVYIWLLAWILVPVSAASEWTQGRVDTTHIDLVVLAFDIPTDPYLSVAAFLGVVAATVLSATVMVNTDLSARLRDRVLGRSVEEAADLSLAYLAVAHAEDARTTSS